MQIKKIWTWFGCRILKYFQWPQFAMLYSEEYLNNANILTCKVKPVINNELVINNEKFI